MLICGQMTLAMTSLLLACVFIVCLHLCSFLLRADWWKSDNSVDGETRELEVEFKFQRCSCKLSFLFLPHCQSALESLLSG